MPAFRLASRFACGLRRIDPIPSDIGRAHQVLVGHDAITPVLPDPFEFRSHELSLWVALTGRNDVILREMFGPPYGQ